MCGIAGIVSLRHRASVGDIGAGILRMTDRLRHRGPDGEGIWVDRRIPIALGHRRLAINDTSPAGHQPMVSESGRYVAVFNGELYNFNALAKDLKEHGHQFRGHSDTEVLLAVVEEWGIEKALQKSNTMLAIAIWDRKERILHLARDRVGKKPLYYGHLDGQLVFASELKAICALLKQRLEINRDALILLLRHNYIPAPYCIYRGIYKLKAGHLLSIGVNRFKNGELNGALPQMARPYWNLKSSVHAGTKHQFKGSIDEAAQELERILSDAVKLRMIADVPLGALLSGGVDSSVVTALMQAQSQRPIKTFSIGFQESEFDETRHANAVAAHLGAEHTELYVSPQDALNIIPELPSIYDEPFSDSSQIPVFLVSRLTRNQVTVALSGDGGDELFCGYPRYRHAERLWRKFAWLPARARMGLGQFVARATSPDVYPLIEPFVKMAKPGMTADKLLNASYLLNATTVSRAAMYKHYISHWKRPETAVLNAREPSTIFADPEMSDDFPEFKSQMMFLDMMTYLPEGILVKVDRASMAVALEVRCPLLDYRVVEFVSRLPLALKSNGQEDKRVLKRVLHRYVPRSLVERPKQGFAIPLGDWLRGPLRDWAEDLLSTERLRSDGFFNPAPIRHYWGEHLAGRGSWHAWLWNVLMFQAWLDEAHQAGVIHEQENPVCWSTKSHTCSS